MNYHKLIFVGHLGADPEMRYLPDGRAVCNFRCATNKGYGEKQQVVWVRVSVFGATAEACNQYLRKGSEVLFEGELNPGENGSPTVWQGKDGEFHASYEVIAYKVEFGAKPSEGEASGSTRRTPF